MSARGLLKFLDGSVPRRQTMAKLRDWFVRQAAGKGEATEDVALAAMAVLLEGIPPEAMPSAFGNVVASVRDQYRAAGVRTPEWISRLLEQV